MLRRAAHDEAPAIAELWLQSRRAAPGIPPSAHSEQEVRAWFEEVLMPTREVWVATAPRAGYEEPELVGMMALHDEWVEQLYIALDHQHRGHGTRLLTVAQASRESLSLWAFEANLPARRFYEARGFVPVGEPSSDNEERTPAIRYHWTRPD
ncbi:MAG: GNAT family N-acetyltransferase [Acidobacteriota bacterium]|nr:GNAT family N-acetyltransferase [Acidobacteriota bacterium]